jgi:rod shape-determining protein MreC
VVLLCLASLLWFRTDSRIESARSLAADTTAWMYRMATAPRDAWEELTDFFNARAQLREDNERLRQENLVLSGQAQQLAAVVAENARYRALLNSAEDINESVLVAQVIAVTPDPARHLLVLDKGQRDGVAVGQPLLGAEGLMGQVVLAGQTSSRALLITDAAHAMPIQVNRNGVRGIVEGTGELDTMVVRHIAATTDIVVGDLLVSSGLGGRFPPGYPVAEVTEVNLKPGDAFATVTAKPMAALDRGRHVLIATDIPADTANP